MKRLHRLLRRGGDQGTVAIFTVIISVAVIGMAGLLIDGGLAIHERERLYDIAEQAARAGADEIDPDILRETGEPVINPATACGRVEEILDTYGAEAEGITCGDIVGNEMHVDFTRDIRPTFLGIVWTGTFTITGTATAHPQDGV